MNYHEITVDGKTIKLRIRMRDHAELDKACGGAFLSALTNEETIASKAWELLGNVLHVAVRAYENENGKYTRAQIDDLMDKMVDEGATMEEAAECIMKTAAVSGFFPKPVAEAILSGRMQENSEA